MTNLSDLIKGILVFVSILVSFFIILSIFSDIKIVLNIIVISFGVLSVIWTLIAIYNLSPKSNLRLLADNFLTCSISILSLSVLRLLSYFVFIPNLVYLELFFIFVTFFFFVVASYYIYQIGGLFGFEHESKNIKKILKTRKR